MISFAKSNNNVEVNFNNGEELQYLSSDASIVARGDSNDILLGDNIQKGNARRILTLPVLEINGRPSDNPTVVATWLRDNYFNGLTLAGSGGGGDASAANQLTGIARLDTIITDLGAFASKTGASPITTQFDNRDFVWSDPANGELDYISYKSGITEVARETFTYDSFGNPLTAVVT